MNWGKWIAVVLVLFAAFIMYMVVGAFKQNIDLVTDDYYAQEMAYDAKMQRRANLQELETKVQVQVNPEGVSLTFPESSVSGEIHFYHPSRELFDKKYEIDLDEQNQQKIQREDLVAGKYRVNITWTQAGKEYLQQEQIFVR